MFGLARISSCPLLFASQSYRISLFRCVLFSLIIFCNSIVVNGQAPANIATDLVHWYRASSCNCASPPCLPSDNVLTISPTVTTGNATASASGVSFDEASFNFNPSFVLSSGYLQFARAGTLDGDFSAFIVLKSSSSTASGGNNNWRTDPWILGGNNTSDLEDFGITWDNGAIRYGHDENNENYVFNSSPMTFKSNPQFQLVVVRNRSSSTNDTISFFSNGAWMAGTGSRRQGDLPLSFTNFYVGQNQPSTGAFFDGSISEIIVYRNNLNNASRIRIESYLALKYGHTLAKNYLNLNSGGSVVYSKSGGFGNRIFGIGAESTSLFDQRISASADLPDLVMMNGNPSAANFGLPNGSTSPYTALANGQYQVIGDDGGLPTLSRNLGSGLPNMLGRTWKATDVGAVGPVTLWFKQSTFTNLSSTENYFLVYGKDPNFGMGENVVPMINQGGPNDFTATVDFPNNDTTYFTIVHGNPTFPVFSGPAGVPDRLELWVTSDNGVTNPNAITQWNDFSENNHHLVNTATAKAKMNSTGPFLNFHNYVRGFNLDQEFGTAGKFRGKTIIAVVQGDNPANNAGIMGFDDFAGLRSDGSQRIKAGTGTADWAQNGLMHSNGATATVSPVANWAIVVSQADPAPTDMPAGKRFYLGEFQNSGANHDSLRVAEILVYDTLMSVGTTRRRLESYLAIKYGLTLSNDYLSSNGTTVYTRGAYTNEIFGIGRDDNGVLYQRQSKSQSSSAIVGMTIGNFALTNSANAAIFTTDNQYLVSGHDGAPAGCWTTDELNVSTPTLQKGEYVRIQREWKLDVNTNWSEDVKFIIDTANVLFPLPAVPKGSSGYYMFLSTNPDFKTNGAVTAIQMTKVAGGYETTLNAGLLNSGGGATLYYTFGARLSKAFEADTVCPGGTVKVFRSHLDNHCSQLTLTDISTFVPQVITSNQPEVTLADFAGVCIDTLYYELPVGIVPGVYAITFDTVAANVSCGTALYGTNTAPQALDTVRVISAEVAGIAWPLIGDSVFCVGENNVAGAVLPGCTQGEFILANSTNPAVTAISQLIPVSGLAAFNTTGFGTLLVHGGITGTHTIQFVTQGGAPCKDTLQLVYTINPVTPTTISYTGSPYCGGDNGLYTPNVTGTVALSTFKASPSLLHSQLDSLSGVPNIPGIPIGNYTITYTPPADACASPSSTTITIQPAIRATFSYLDSNFCQGAGFIGPWIVNRPSTGYFGLTTSSTVGLVFDDTTGVIDLNLTPVGTYSLAYFVDTTACHFDDTVLLHIRPRPNTAFNITGGDTICVSAPAVALVPTVPGGSFFSHDGRLSVITTGTDSLEANPSFVGGPFLLHYKITDPYCTDSTAKQVWVKGQQLASIQYPDSAYCKNEMDPLPQFASGTAGGQFFQVGTGMVVDTFSGKIDLSASNAGVHVIRYQVPDLTCPNTFRIDTIRIDSVKPADFTLGFLTHCANIVSPTFSSIPPDSNHFTLWNGPNEVLNAIIAGPRLNTGLPPGNSLPVRNIRTTPYCSDTAFQFVTIIRKDSANIEFIPDIVCIGDFNPYPFILGDGGGFFSSIIPGDSVNHINGTVIIDSVTVADTFYVRYVTQGSCPSSDSAMVVVTQQISTTFSYPVSAYCTSDSFANTTPILTPNPQGMFSTLLNQNGGFLDIDPVTGVINLPTSTAGTYGVRYEINQTGSCAGQHTEFVSIFEPDLLTTMTISPDTFCPSVDTVKVNINGTLGGIFSGDQNLVFHNSDSGVISLKNSIIDLNFPSTTFQVVYSLPGECNDRRTADITILRPDDAEFSYPGTGSYCSGTPNVFPTAIDSSGPDYYGIIPAGVVGLDSASGELFLLDADTTANFLVYHVTAGRCPNTDTIQLEVAYAPVGIGLDAHPSETICVGEFVEIRAVGQAAFFFYYKNDDTTTLGSGTFHLFTDIVDEDTVRVRFVTDFGCTIEDTIIIRANPIPTDSLVSFPEIVSADEPYDVILHTFANGTQFAWKLEDIVGEVSFENLAGLTAPPAPANTDVPISQVVTLQSDFTPATFTYVVTPLANGCFGAPRRIEIKVNPNKLPVFVPQVFTPDGNGKNETWLIQWKDGVLPQDYTIKLFNDAGGLVKTMNPLVSDWNGDALPDGVYWYILYDVAGEMVEAGGLTIRRK